jgi:titin
MRTRTSVLATALAAGSALAVPPQACCPADFNRDCTIDSGDLEAFINAFIAGAPPADLTADGQVDSGDLLVFINAFLAGTPACLPPPPTNVRMGDIDCAQADVLWTDSSICEEAYRVSISTDGVSFNNVGGDRPEDAERYIIQNLSPGAPYWVRVRSKNCYGVSEPVVIANAPFSTITLAPPTQLSCMTLGPTSIRLNWTDNADRETEYKVARSTDGVNFDGPIAVLGPNTVQFTDTGLNPSTTYWYRVRAFSPGCGDSLYTNDSSCDTTSGLPAAPTNLRTVDIDSCEVDLAWDDNSNNEDGFRIARSLTGGPFPDAYNNIDTVDPDQTRYDVQDLCPETAYWFAVRAFNSFGPSLPVILGPVVTQKLRTPADCDASRDNSTPQVDVIITWTDTNGCEDGYSIARKRADQPDSAYNNIHQSGPLPGQGLQGFYRDAGPSLVAGTMYTYRIRARKECNGSIKFSDPCTDEARPN